MAKQWIQKARTRMEKKGTVGSLRKAMGVSGDKTIPVAKLHAAKAKGGAIAKKANFALNVRK